MSAMTTLTYSFPSKSISHGLTTYVVAALIYTSLLFSPSADAQDSKAKLVLAPQQLEQYLEPELTAGRWQLVMFWTTWCPVCKSDFKRLQVFLDEQPELELDLMGVVFDGIESETETHALVKKHNLNYTHFLTTQEVAAEYYLNAAEEELVGPPSYLLFDRNNEVAAISANAIDLDSLELLLD